MSPARKVPWGVVVGATTAGALVAGLVAWQVQLHALQRQITSKQRALKKLVISGRIPPTQEVMDYLTDRTDSLAQRHDHWERLAVASLPAEIESGDPQLYYHERFVAVQRALERLTAARGLAAPTSLGFPKELPPSDSVPRFLVQLALIEDVAKVILDQDVSTLTSFKVDDPEALLAPDTDEPFLLRLPVRVRVSGSLPVMMQVLSALQQTRPILDLQGVRMATGKEPDQLDVELVVSRYLAMAVPRQPRLQKDPDAAGSKSRTRPRRKPRQRKG